MGEGDGRGGKKRKKGESGSGSGEEEGRMQGEELGLRHFFFDFKDCERTVLHSKTVG